ncbi:hypothetical protein PAMP_015437 [Pampus punctatissimus]
MWTFVPFSFLSVAERQAGHSQRGHSQRRHGRTRRWSSCQIQITPLDIDHTSHLQR